MRPPHVKVWPICHQDGERLSERAEFRRGATSTVAGGALQVVCGFTWRARAAVLSPKCLSKRRSNLNSLVVVRPGDRRSCFNEFVRLVCQKLAPNGILSFERFERFARFPWAVKVECFPHGVVFLHIGLYGLVAICFCCGSAYDVSRFTRPLVRAGDATFVGPKGALTPGVHSHSLVDS